MPPAQLERPRILYFADAMCSWCYGFAPEMAAVLGAMEGRLDMLLFAGGLRPFNKEPMTPRLAAYLSETYQHINALTGQRFVRGAMHGEDFVYDTEPASRAVVTMRYLATGQEYGYMLGIQRAFYAGSEDIRQADVLADYAEAFDIDRSAFLEAFASPAMMQATLADFEVAKRFGIDGFPTLILHRQGENGVDEKFLIGKGFVRASVLIERLEAALALPFGTGS